MHCKIVIYFPGGSNINSELTIPEAIKLREKGVHISIIAVGDDMNEFELQGIASVPVDHNIVRSQSYQGLPEVLSASIRSTCNGKGILLTVKGIHTVSLSSSLYFINQKPMIPRTHFHCITTWVAHSSR